MEKLRYSDLLKRLQGFDSWLSSLGLEPRPNDRIHQAFRVLQKAEEASRKGQETGRYIEIDAGDWFPLVEAVEAHDVFAAFHLDKSPVIAKALKRALSGPNLPIDENQKNRDGRNIWYELALAAEWRLRGASVALEEPDLRLTREGITFLVACKRPASERSIEASIDDAAKQLRRNLDQEPKGHFGVAAISLSCAFNAGDLVFNGKMNNLRSLLEIQLDKHSRQISTLDDPRICCVLFQVATPGLAGQEVDLVRASFTVAQELTPSVGSKIFEKHAQDMDKAPKQLWEHCDSGAL